MEYRHNPPSLSELRKLRKEMEQARHEAPAPVPRKKKGIFSFLSGGYENTPAPERDTSAEKLASYEHDIILAHLENQNELLLELARKIDRADRSS